MSYIITWFEIPATDLERARKFYQTVMAIEMPVNVMGPYHMAFFPNHQPHTSGAVVQSPAHVPSDKGSVVYLYGGDDLNVPLARVEAAGGKVLMPKTEIGGDNGFMAFFLDTEGNRVALHSMK